MNFNCFIFSYSKLRCLEYPKNNQFLQIDFEKLIKQIVTRLLSTNFLERISRFRLVWRRRYSTILESPVNEFQEIYKRKSPTLISQYWARFRRTSKKNSYLTICDCNTLLLYSYQKLQFRQCTLITSNEHFNPKKSNLYSVS